MKFVLFPLIAFLLAVAPAHATVVGFCQKHPSKLKALADQGNREAQFCVARMYEDGGVMLPFGKGRIKVPKNDTQAVRWYRKAAEKGHADAQMKLGLMLREGRGVPRHDNVESFQWISKAAQQGRPMAQYELAFMYERGIGTQQDKTRAIRCYVKARQQGFSKAGIRIREIFRKGLNAYKQRDYKSALETWQMLAEGGDFLSQHALGVMFLWGQGVQQNNNVAAAWFRKSAEQGNPHAQVSYGSMLARGKGVTQNYVLAYMWLQQGIWRLSNKRQKKNREKALEMLDQIAKEMKPKQIEEAKRLAKEWAPKKYRAGK